MEEFSHGGNVYEISKRFGYNVDDLIDLSASINPLGPPEGLKEEIVQRFSFIKYYPDIRSDELISTLSEFHGIPKENIAVGNGSTELLYWLPYAMGWNRVALVLPTFSEYFRVLKNKRTIVRKLICSWETSFQPSVEQLDALIHASTPDALFLTHPGSPAGTPLTEDVIQFIVDSSKEANFYWVIDEVFIDFVEELSLKHYVNQSDRIIILRSLTKFYSLPGLRIGYIFAPKSVIESLTSFLPPWSVNTFAQFAGVFCLKNRDFIKETVSFFNEERNRVIERLNKISNIGVLPSVANYVLIRISEKIPINAYKLCEELISQHKILIRNCANFDGLNDKYVRVAISTKNINDLWMNALDGLLGYSGDDLVEEVCGEKQS